LFSNIATAVFTYYFTRKKDDEIIERSEELWNQNFQQNT
jgi:hypothetical protein